MFTGRYDLPHANGQQVPGYKRIGRLKGRSDVKAARPCLPLRTCLAVISQLSCFVASTSLSKIIRPSEFLLLLSTPTDDRERIIASITSPPPPSPSHTHHIFFTLAPIASLEYVVAIPHL